MADSYAQIRSLAAKGSLSHAFLLLGDSPEPREKLARFLAAALLCQAPELAPCSRCSACRKLEKNIHPDLITLERLPDKRELLVDQVRGLSREAWLLPNEGRRKVFLIPEAELLNASAQNALLKLLEEPPAYAAFLLLGSNPGAFLPTIRSRCFTLRSQGESAAGGDEQAAALAEAWLSGNRLLLAKLAFRAEKLEKDRFDRLLERLYAAAGLRARAAAGLPERERALALAALAGRLRQLRKVNVSAGHCLGLLLSDAG